MTFIRTFILASCWLALPLRGERVGVTPCGCLHSPGPSAGSVHPEKATGSTSIRLSAAHRLLDAAVWALRKTPYVTLVSVRRSERGLIEVTEWMRDSRRFGNQCFLEGVITSGAGQAVRFSAGSDRQHGAAFIGGRWDPLPDVPLWRQFPLRPLAQRALPDSNHVHCTVSEEDAYHGRPCRLVCIELGLPDGASSGPADKVPDALPTRFAYWIDSATGFLVGVRATSATGQLLADYGYQEISLAPIPDAQFSSRPDASPSSRN